MTAFTALVVRDMRLSVRVGGGALMGALFFLIVVTMMPFALGPDLALLARIGPALTFIGLIGAALSVALRRGGLLLAVLVLPLTIPVLIFGVAAANAAIVGPAPFGPPFTILCALSLASLVLGPVAAAAALRHGLE